jgi:excisionase family DNA binding protein
MPGLVSGKMFNSMDEWLTPKDVSTLLKVSKPLPYQWVKRGILPHYKLMDKVIRFKKSDIEAFIARCRIEGKNGHSD